MLAHAGGVTLAPVLGDTIGLLHAPDAKDARTTRDRNSRIDGRGYGLVPYLMPYRSNSVELDSADMADDVELLSNMRTVARAARWCCCPIPPAGPGPYWSTVNSEMALRCHSAPRSTISRMAR